MLKINHIEKDTNDEIGAEEGILKQWSANIRNLKPLLFFMDACHYLILFLCVSVWLCGCMYEHMGASTHGDPKGA